MCGPETPSATPRVGARVDFFAPQSKSQRHLPLGNLLFLNPTSPTSSRATHIRFHHPPTASGLHYDTADDSQPQSLLVSIHTTGDLTQPLASAGLMRQFTLHSPGRSDAALEMPLGAALSLGVGGDGIIGRRVSMRRGGELLADGIVGFNFLPPARAAGAA